ncbi:MAG: hypothetical protein K2K44_11005 [Oscillospiraceae bacterium]|nr:hypothetical protein [Oscillospiraceae bacterium]
MNIIEIMISIMLFAPPVYGIYLIVKGILYYKFAEEREATVAEISDLKGARNGIVTYNISVDIEDDGEIFNIPMEVGFGVKRIEYALKKGDKITVWYLKKYKRCIAGRSDLIRVGLGIIAIVVIFVFCLVFSLFAIKH